MSKKLRTWLIAAGLLLVTISVVYGAAVETINTLTAPRPGVLADSLKTYWAINCNDTDASGTDQIVAAPGTGKHLYLQYITINTPTAEQVTILDGANVLLGPVYLAVGATFVTYDFGETGLQLDPNSALNVDTAATVDVTIFVKGYTN